jgi:hypothetical protein
MQHHFFVKRVGILHECVVLLEKRMMYNYLTHKKSLFCCLLTMTHCTLFAQEALQYQPVHLGLVYPISTHDAHAPEIINYVSVHALAGVSGGEIGTAVSGIATIIKGTQKGLVVSGISTFVREDASGTQIASIANIVLGDVNGVQIAGVNNLSANINGLQIVGLSKMKNCH